MYKLLLDSDAYLSRSAWVRGGMTLFAKVPGFALLLIFAASSAFANEAEAFRPFLDRFCKSENIENDTFYIGRIRFPISYSVQYLDEAGKEHNEKRKLAKKEFLGEEITVCRCDGEMENKVIRKKQNKMEVDLIFGTGCSRSLTFESFKGKWYLIDEVHIDN